MEYDYVLYSEPNLLILDMQHRRCGLQGFPIEHLRSAMCLVCKSEFGPVHQSARILVCRVQEGPKREIVEVEIHYT
jgi:hypothetical protein